MLAKTFCRRSPPRRDRSTGGNAGGAILAPPAFAGASRRWRGKPHILAAHPRLGLLGWVGDDAEFIAGEMAAAAGPETAAKVTNYEHEGAPMPRAAGALEGVER
jgi:hypothetical protein